MKILITGAAGFIGYNFSKYLLDKTNYKIIGVDNINDYYSVKIKKKRLEVLKRYKNFSFHKIDIKNKQHLKKIFNSKKIKMVFHLAAQAGVRYSLVNPRSYIESNTLGFFNIIEFVREKNVKKFFYASSSSVYGESTKFPLKEIYKISPKNIYGLTKKNNEETADIFFQNSNITCVGLRFFTVFGEWGRPDMLIYKYLQSIYNKRKKFYLNNFGDHTRDFTYISDVCEIMFKLSKKRKIKNHEVFNICSNKPIKITKILEFINSNFDRKPRIFKRKFQLADVKKTHGDNSKIKHYVGKKKYIDIQVALHNTSKWFKNNWKLYF